MGRHTPTLYVEDRDQWFAFPRDRWVYDRLTLAARLGYPCGPAGVPFPTAGVFCAKPIINLAGMGHARKVVLPADIPADVPPGWFWSPWFLGPHVSVNYRRIQPDPHWTPVEAHRCVPRPDGRPGVWVRTTDFPPLPALFDDLQETEHLNVEFIGGHVIEAHIRLGFDFAACPDAVAALVVWEDDDDPNPAGLVLDIAGKRRGFVYVR